MPRKKSYLDPSLERHVDDTAFEAGAEQPGRMIRSDGGSVIEADEAYINFKLLSPEARLVDSKCALDLRAWLGIGIDAWVWSSIRCVNSMFISGKYEISSLTACQVALDHFFAFLTNDRSSPLVVEPIKFAPIHSHEFVRWLRGHARDGTWALASARQYYFSAKRVMEEMLEQGDIDADVSLLFPRGAMPRPNDESRQTSFSALEQGRISEAIKKDLVATHKGRMTLLFSELQALRFLLVTHRQGLNLTPVLELNRRGLAPGQLPGTVRLTSIKHRGNSIKSYMGRAAENGDKDSAEPLTFSLAEGAVLQQAIASSEELVAEAPKGIKDKIWLYRSESSRDKGEVITCLSPASLLWCVTRLVYRHDLRGDDGKPLKINSSRFRKSFFDRAYRVTDGSLPITANLMGNSPGVAATRYPSMNEARKAEFAEFLNEDYVNHAKGVRDVPVCDAVISVRRPTVIPINAIDSGSLENTPLSKCSSPTAGEYAPKNGTLCERFVMCLFCSSFVIVGTEEDLWKLFSFQQFAKSELAYLDDKLGVMRTADEAIEELRDRYRVCIPFISEYPATHFPAAIVQAARRRTQAGLHPFWKYQSERSRIGRNLGQ